MFYLYHHNDLSRLAELFEALRARNETAPLARDTVLAPNAGIGRWLRIQVAESEGIAANIDGQLPGEFLWQLLRAVMTGDEADAGDHFEPDCLPWHLYAALPEIAYEVPAVADYLGRPVDEVRRYQLAAQLADVFDQYLVYRADMLAAWQAGEVPAAGPGRWQARVWHWLTRDHRLGGVHRASVLRRFVDRLGRDTSLQKRVKAHCPNPLYCFGLVALAPDHLRLLYGLAEHVDVHFLLPNPSEAYWGDITAGRLPLALPERDAPDDVLPGEAQVEAGHPLLSALGRMARDTLRVLYSDEFVGMVEPELGEAMAYDRPKPDSLLHRIQHDIVALDVSDPPQGMADDDTSFEIHACHSPLREIQVLQDQILDRLAADDARAAAGQINPEARLAARDIIVMLPDVATYAPAIQAVFGGAPADRYLPFGLADRSRSAAHPIVTTVSALLDLPLSRWTASELFDLLSVPAVMRRFRLTAGELDTLAEWVGAAGIRWGRDSDHRAGLGAGAFDQNTWRFGLDRLLLGVAQADDDTLVDGVAPWSDLEGGATAALGKLWRFEDTLATVADALTAPATPGEWQTRLNHMVDALIVPAADAPDEQRAVDSLRSVFARFDQAEACTRARALTEDRSLSWPAVRDSLRATLDTAAERQPFLSGGITFCGLVPLRAVPFAMVAVLGMNDAAFPRQDTGRAFNVMFEAPRLGDRNTRDDDRLLFLQALTAAGRTFYISYIGQDVTSGETRPPSPIVGETLEFIQQTYFHTLGENAAAARLVHHQPMQPFSPRYFMPDEPDSRVFTYAGAWHSATAAALGQRRSADPLRDTVEAPVVEPIEAVDLDTLKRFFDHPARAFFRERIKLNLELDARHLDDAEPVGLHPLAAAALRDRLLAQASVDDEAELSLTPSALERARGQLPPPPLSEARYADEAASVNTLLPIARTWQAAGTVSTLDIRLGDIAGLVVTGRIEGLYDAGRVLRRLRTGKLRTRFRLRYWIDALATAAYLDDTLAVELAGFDPDKKTLETVAYHGHIAPEPARQALTDLVQYYLDGLQAPLAYHPDLADAYSPERQSKAFDNLSFRFKPRAFHPHHLLRDPYFCLMLGPPEAPLGEREDESAFVAAIEAVVWPMNDVLERSASSS